MKEILEAMKATNAVFSEEVVAKRNSNALGRVYTADARVLPPGAPMVSGRTAIQQFWEGAIQGLGVTRASLTTVDAIPAGNDVVEIGSATLDTAGGSVTAKYVVRWKKEDGQWKWHVDIWNANG